MRQTTKDYRNIATLTMYAERAAKQGFLSEITCVFAYKKTLKLNNNGSYFKVYSDGSPSRVCKEQSDGIAIVRTFQPPLLSLNRKSAIASPTTLQLTAGCSRIRSGLWVSKLLRHSITFQLPVLSEPLRSMKGLHRWFR